MKLSVVIITKNEERNIRECLETVNWADEIIVVDSFSTDNTVEIARGYTDKVFQRAFTNYADQRNFAASLASCPWILVVDADERVTPDLKAEIQQVLSDNSFSGYRIPHLDYIFGKPIRHGGWYPQYHVRLYRKDMGRWEGEVHEKVILEGKVGCLRNPLIHYSHLRIANFLHKLNQYTSVEADYLYRRGQRTNILKLIFWPPVVFVYKYFYRLGFLDGFHGLVLAVLLACYHFVKHAKLLELQLAGTADNGGLVPPLAAMDNDPAPPMGQGSGL